jgi:hypothetical protein
MQAAAAEAGDLANGIELLHRLAIGTQHAEADRLGSKRAAFPGDHMGFAPYPDRFAETLHLALSGA